MGKIIDGYFYIWALVLPITSVLLLPTVTQLTTAHLLGYASIYLVVVGSLFREKAFMINWIVFIFIYLLFVFLGQIGLALSDIQFYGKGLRLVDPNDTSVLMRYSIYAQSEFLVGAVALFIFVKMYYKEKWDKPIFIGIALLVAYGFYEFIYFILFQENGDFLTNRYFGEGASRRLGSLFQLIELGNFTLLRMKSLTGEPSMFAFTLLPVWIYSIHKGKKWLQRFLFLALALTFSTTAYLGMFIYFFIRFRYFGLKDRYTMIMGIFGIFMLIIFWEQVNVVFETMVIDKFTLSNESGSDRFDFFSTSMKFFFSLPFINLLFGVGFGTIRSTDFFSTLMVNCGLLGFLLFTMLFLYPVFKLKPVKSNIGLRSILIVTYLTMMLSVPEFSYMSTWLFLGIAYKQLRLEKKMSLSSISEKNSIEEK